MSNEQTDWVGVAADLATDFDKRAEELDRTGAFCAENVARLREVGLVSAPVPADLGGGGASYATTSAVLRALGRGCGPTAVTLSMHYHLLAAQCWRHVRELPAPALARVAEGDLVLISTGASDWLSSNGEATAVDGGYRVRARKSPASGCPAGDVLVTSVRREDGADGPTVLHCSVPFTADGVSIEETWDTMGQRATGSHTVVLDDVYVPAESVALERPADRWHPVFNTVAGVALPLIMSAYLGIADRIVDEVVELAGPRAEDHHVAPLVGEMLRHRAVAEDAVAAEVRRVDEYAFEATDDQGRAALARKVNAAEAVEAVARTAVTIAGGAGFHRGLPIERLYRDAMGAAFHPLPTPRADRFLGRLALGVDPAS